jgi:hypothetical protein
MMNYNKPEVVLLGSAINAVQHQGQMVKPGTQSPDSPAVLGPFTINAYEADE